MKPVLYLSEESKALPSGTYLALFHGRDDATIEMDDWGFNGPMIGPIIGFHVTYADHIRVGFNTVQEAIKFFPHADDNWVDLEFVNDCLKYEGKFYGDYTVHPHQQTRFDDEKPKGPLRIKVWYDQQSGYVADVTFRDIPGAIWSSAYQVLTGQFDVRKADMALKAAEAFIVGFEDDPMQEGMHLLLQRVREAQVRVEEA